MEIDHEKNFVLCDATLLMGRAGIGPNDGRTGECPQEHGKRHDPEHGLRPEELQSAPANQQINVKRLVPI
jgi:hypothetical protein